MSERARNELLAAVAFRRGFRLLPCSVNSGGHWRVVRKAWGRTTKVNLIFWEDGAITRGDIRLDLAKCLTVSQAAKMLGVRY